MRTKQMLGNFLSIFSSPKEMIVSAIPNENCGYGAFVIWLLSKYQADKKAFYGWLLHPSRRDFLNNYYKTTLEFIPPGDTDTSSPEHKAAVIAALLAEEENYFIAQTKLSPRLRNIIVTHLTQTNPFLIGRLWANVRHAFYQYIFENATNNPIIHSFTAAQYELIKIIIQETQKKAETFIASLPIDRNNNDNQATTGKEILKHLLPQLPSEDKERVYKKLSSWFDTPEAQTEYYHRLKQSNVLPSDIELKCLADMLGIRIEIHKISSQNEITVYSPFEEILPQPVTNEVIRLFHSETNALYTLWHWDLICSGHEFSQLQVRYNKDFSRAMLEIASDREYCYRYEEFVALIKQSTITQRDQAPDKGKASAVNYGTFSY